jgi:hypothetical protein
MKKWRWARLSRRTEQLDFDRQEPREPSRAGLRSQFAGWAALPAVRLPQSSILNPRSSALPLPPIPALTPQPADSAPASAPVHPVNPVNPVRIPSLRRVLMSLASASPRLSGVRITPPRRLPISGNLCRSCLIFRQNYGPKPCDFDRQNLRKPQQNPTSSTLVNRENFLGPSSLSSVALAEEDPGLASNPPGRGEHGQIGPVPPESQRDFGTKPRVARHELPWVIASPAPPTATRLWPASPVARKGKGRNRVAVDDFVWTRTRGRLADSPTPGWRTQSRWDCQNGRASELRGASWSARTRPRF